MIVLLAIFSWFWQWNNFENRLIYGKVKAYKTMVPFWTTLYVTCEFHDKSELIITPRSLNVVTLTISVPFIHNRGISVMFTFLLKQISNSFVLLVLIAIALYYVNWTRKSALDWSVLSFTFRDTEKNSCVINVFGVRGIECKIVYNNHKDHTVLRGVPATTVVVADTESQISTNYGHSSQSAR